MFKSDVYDFFYNLQYNPGASIKDKYSNIPSDIDTSRGIRNGDFIDLYLVDNILSKIMKYTYGEIFLERIDSSDNHIEFTRRPVPSGGGLYPNCLYVLIPDKDKNIHKKFQYNPSLHSLTFIGNEDSCNKEKVYIFITAYFWRNFLKYQEFAYRLIGLDTGYLLSMLSLNLDFHSLNHKIEISSRMNKRIIEILGLDLSFEAPYVAISLDVIPEITSLNSLNTNACFEYPSTVNNDPPLKFFSEIELASLTNDYKLSFTNPGELKFINRDKVIKRVSPGGEFFLAKREVNKAVFYNLVSGFIKSLAHNKSISKDIKIYVYTNKVQGLNKQYFELKSEKLKIISQHLSESLFQESLTRKNFNLLEVPFLIHIGIDLQAHLDEYSYAGYKIAQIKVGYVSNLLAQIATSKGFFSHPMMSYDSNKLESSIPIDDSITLMNQIVLAEDVPLNRLQIEL